MTETKRGKMTELRYPGMAPTPDQMERLIQADRETALGMDSDGNDVPKYEIRNEDFPDGVAMGIVPTLRNEVNQIIYSTHWEYQKRILDHVDAQCSNDRQWQTLRRILMGIMTEQVERTRMLVGQRIRQEMHKTMEIPGSESKENE